MEEPAAELRLLAVECLVIADVCCCYRFLCCIFELQSTLIVRYVFCAIL